ncbi:hypothetical protein [Hoeflea sp. TYP-13]|uniref:hypothetical protein n=1 Tax=Hoeflea sp. TYP-13 TaxID=3230023 RepID=UPI0034C5C1FC
MDGKTSLGNARMYWDECERQLFAMVGMDADRYEKIILAVRALADEMRDISSIEQLTASWPQAGEMLSKAAAARGFSASMLPQDKVAGAAFALRQREINQQLQYQARRNLINSARQSGDDWVMLDESGNIESGNFDAYRSTEMHVASGYAVMSMVQVDPGSGAPEYVVAVVRLDPETGELLDAEPGIQDWMSHAQQAEFSENRDMVRQKIGSISPQKTQ